MSKSMKVILGTMEMGRGIDSKQSLEMIQSFIKEGYSDLDTAIMSVQDSLKFSLNPP